MEAIPNGDVLAIEAEIQRAISECSQPISYGAYPIQHLFLPELNCPNAASLQKDYAVFRPFSGPDALGNAILFDVVEKLILFRPYEQDYEFWSTFLECSSIDHYMSQKAQELIELLQARSLRKALEIHKFLFQLPAALTLATRLFPALAQKAGQNFQQLPQDSHRSYAMILPAFHFCIGAQIDEPSPEEDRILIHLAYKENGVALLYPGLYLGILNCQTKIDPEDLRLFPITQKKSLMDEQFFEETKALSVYIGAIGKAVAEIFRHTNYVDQQKGRELLGLMDELKNLANESQTVKRRIDEIFNNEGIAGLDAVLQQAVSQ